MVIDIIAKTRIAKIDLLKMLVIRHRNQNLITHNVELSGADSRVRSNDLLAVLNQKEEMMTDEIDTFEMPEDTPEQIMDKIQQFAMDIWGDWTNPKSEAKAIYVLCDKLKSLFES